MLTMVPVSVRRDRQQYYLRLSHEDYYVRSGEPLGEWVGRGAARLGLARTVEGFEFLSLLDGKARDGEEPLVKVRRGAQHDPGWDLTFSAPKGVSVLWAVAGDEHRATIEACFKAAVLDTLTYVEDHYQLARRGPQGRRRVRVELLAALFLHGTSRALNPQLHFHAVVPNVAVRADGTTGAILSRPLYRDKLHLGHFCRYQFAGHLQRELGLEVYWYGRDLFDLVGVPEPAKRAESERRQAIEAYLAERGLTSAEAAAIAAVQTRRPKEMRAREELFQQWREELREYGFGPEQARALLQRARPAPEQALVEEPREAERRAQQAVPEPEAEPEPDRGRAQQAEEQHAELDAEAEERVRQGLEELAGEEGGFRHQEGVDEAMRRTREWPLRYERLMDAFWNGVRQAQLMIEELRSGLTYVRRELHEGLRKQFASDLYDLRLAPRRGVAVGALAPSIFRDSLDDERRRVFDHLATEGRRLRLVDGPLTADAYKLMAEALHVWDLAGYEAHVIVPSRAQAEELRAATGLRVHTAYRACASLAQGPMDDALHHLWMLGRAGSGLPTWKPDEGRLTLNRRSVVLVIDPGGFSNAEIALITNRVLRNGAVGLFYGDSALRPSTVAINPRLPRSARVPSPWAELKTAVRPVRYRGVGPRLPLWRAEAAQEVAAGDTIDALDRFAGEERLTVTRELPDAWLALLHDWEREGARRPREHLILAPTEDLAHGLSRRAQSRRQAAGKLGDLAATSGRDQLYVGDRVRFQQPQRSWGVGAGELGTIWFVVPGLNQVAIRLDQARRRDGSLDQTQVVVVPAEELALGYAVMPRPGEAYRAEQCYGLFAGDRRGLYQQASQVHGELRLYVPLDELDDELRDELSQRHAETLQAQQASARQSVEPGPGQDPEQEIRQGR